jgi:hypothetical protein
MVIVGRVENGVVVLKGGASLPEGTEVQVVVPPAPMERKEALSAAERQRICEILDRVAALPIDGSSEPFSGEDHDKVLYGNP